MGRGLRSLSLLRERGDGRAPLVLEVDKERQEEKRDTNTHDGKKQKTDGISKKERKEEEWR